MFLFGSPVNRVKARRPRFLLTLLFNIAFILPWRFVSRTQFYLHTHTNILSLSVIISCILSSPSLWFLFGVRNRMMIKKLQSKKCGVPYISYCIKQWLKRWNNMNISNVKFLEQWNDRDRLYNLAFQFSQYRAAGHHLFGEIFEEQDLCYYKVFWDGRIVLTIVTVTLRLKHINAGPFSACMMRSFFCRTARECDDSGGSSLTCLTSPLGRTSFVDSIRFA